MTEEVIVERIEGIKTLVKEKFEENAKEHATMESQVCKTNGRVRLLEKFIWALGGAITILGFIVTAIAVPILLNILFK